MNRSAWRESDRSGLLHWMLPLMLALTAVMVLLSGRDLSSTYNDLSPGASVAQHPLFPWLQRLVSLLLLLISAERLFHHAITRAPLPAPWLTAAFTVYWSGTVATSAIFGAHPQVSHEYAYPLVIGLAGLLASGADRERVVAAVRTALFFFLLAGVLLAAVVPSLVLDLTYRQGLVPGLPRFGGLAAHPVAMGLFAQTFLLCLWVHPFRNGWLRSFAWVLGLAVLFVAQSKTAWIAFTLCALVLLVVRHGSAVWKRMSDPREGAFGVLVCLCVMAAVAGVLGLILAFGFGADAGSFLDSPEGAQLMTMTGRDQIWAIALEEWRASPLFGYGPGLWDDDFRASIQMPNATNAHNQFMDTLARSGALGATVLVLYALVLMVGAFRAARATGGLSLALFLALALRSVSEVPLMVLGYGTEFFTHLLLLVTIASAHAPRASSRPAAAVATPYRTAS